MKLILAGFVLIFLELAANAANPTSWSGNKTPGFWDFWSVNVSGGLTSYYGDRSLFDSDILQKLQSESGPGVSIMLTKHFKHTFGISGQILYGGFSSEYSPEISFSTSIVEYNLQAHVELINLFSRYKTSRLGLTLYGGIGQFLFSVVETQNVQDEIKETTHDTGTPEFVYFIGGGIHYHISQKFSVTGSMGLRRANNDKLDNLEKNNNNDFYSYLSFGISYNFNNYNQKSRKSGRSRGMSYSRTRR